jgi:SAM-dependent methyltransferase
VSGVFRVSDAAYDDFMGRYAVRLAPLFADFAGVSAGQRALDVGAGTGALTGELIDRGLDVVAAEPSPEFATALRERYPGLEVHQAPAESMPLADDACDVALAQLVVAFMADAPTGVAEMARIAPSVAVCMWGVEEMEMFAAIGRTSQAIDGSAAETGARRYRTQAELVELLGPIGEVESASLDVTASYEDYDEYWRALSGQVGPAGAWFNTLDDEQRTFAREEMHRQLGSPTGPFELTGRCFAARATRA